MKKINVFLWIFSLATVVLVGVLFHVPRNEVLPLPVGEWSEPGTCNSRRTVFTSDGRYLVFTRNEDVWADSFEGIYFSLDEEKLFRLQRQSPEVINALIMAEGPSMGGYVIEIHELTQDTFRGMWNTRWGEGLSFENPDDALFKFTRCPKR